MKRSFIFIVFLIILILPLTSAINFEMKDSFNKEEILTAKLSGDFINPPLQQNIYLYRGHVTSPADVSIAKINDEYYIYAPLAGKTPDNYSLVIENISYKKGSILITNHLVKNFSITDNLVDFIIDKGFINTKTDFFIELENLLDEDLGLNMNITTLSGEEGGITSYEEDEDYPLTLNPGSEKINFKINITKPTIKLIQFSSKNTSYSIPVSLSKDINVESKFYSFKIEPSEIGVTMNITDSRQKTIYIYNTGTGILTNIRLKLSDSLKPYVIISKDTFAQILTENNAKLNMSMLSSGTDGKTITGTLFIETGQGVSNSINISVTTEKGYVPTEEELSSQVYSDGKCASDGGKICSDNEECTETTFLAIDGVCCPGKKCIPKNEGSSLPMIIGWGILVLIIVVGAWFFLKKYRGIKKPLDILAAAKGRK